MGNLCLGQMDEEGVILAERVEEKDKKVQVEAYTEWLKKSLLITGKLDTSLFNLNERKKPQQ